MSARELLQLPYNKRRIIVVRDDARPARPALRSSGSGAALRAINSYADRMSPAARMITGLAMGNTLALATELVKASREMRQGGENLVPVSSVDAAELRFPVGHPRGKVAYIGHPVDPPVYIPVADFHRFLFEHKVAEALRLIRSLGAVTVDVVRVEGWDQTVGVALGVALPDAAPVDVSAAAERERGSTRSVLSSMRLKPTQAAWVPDDVVWLPHEPLWQEVARARLESGLDSFVLDVRSTDDYGVNAKLQALVTKAGLEAGGSFIQHKNTVWRLQGTFS